MTPNLNKIVNPVTPVKRVDQLTPEQRAQMDAWADKWIEVGLRTGDADRVKFESAAQRCYEAAGIPWPGNVIWVPSPLVLAIAAPVAAYVIQRERNIRKPAQRAVRGAVGDAVGGAVRDAVRDAVGDAVGGAVGGAVRDAVGDAVGDAVRDAVGDAVGGAVDGAVRDAVGGAVDGAVGDAVGGAVRDAVRGAVDGAVGDAVDGAVRDAVRDAVDGAVGGAVDGAVGDAVKRIRDDIARVISNGWCLYLGGQFWAGGYWWGAAYTSFFREVCGLQLQGDLWAHGKAYEETVESACWWYPHRDFVMVCERPTVIERELVNTNQPRGWGSHRLHSETGPALGFRDGWGVYAVHGVRVPPYVIKHPELITWQAIESETNAEVRRVMISRYGAERYIVDSGASVVHQLPADHPMKGLRTGRLLVKEVADDEPIVYVDLLNSTPEPDGTTKRYLLRVDPNAYDGEATRNVHAAAASTWRDSDSGQLTYRDWRDYAPAAES